jgi:divalent metal cation (Fe/Co/Zn/Cd) transporter
LWWVDPAAGIAISIWIMKRWYDMTMEQVGKVLGKAAPQSFIAKVTSIAARHHPLVKVDVVRAYHLGSRYGVEVEIVLPGEMTLVQTHDISLSLQSRIESLPECERAFVHVDYALRDNPEHKAERIFAKSA